MNYKKILFHFALLCSGFLWGAIYLHEITLCNQIWFLLYIVLGNGAGFFLGLKLPGRFWKTVLIAGLLLLVWGSGGRWAVLLLPWLSGLWYRSIPLAVVNWRFSRSLCAGLFLGALLSGFAGTFFAVAGIVIFLPFLWKKYFRWQWVTVILISMAVIFCFRGERSGKNMQLSTGSAMTALGLVDSKEKPEVLLTGRKNDIKNLFINDDFLMVANPDFISPGLNSKKYDLVIAESLPELYDGGISALVRMLAPGGILVVPVEFCGALPQWQFLILPGSNGKFAVAGQGRKLSFDPDKIDANLSRYSMHLPENIRTVPGALGGMLQGVNEKKVEKMIVFNDPDIFRAAFFVALITVITALLRICSVSRTRRDLFRLMLNSGSYTVFLLLLLPEIIQTTWFLPVMYQFLSGLGIYWYFRRPVDKNYRFSGVLGIGALMAFWAGRNGNWLWQFPAVFLGGFSFSVLDGELRCKTGIRAEVIRFAGIACGMAAMIFCNRFGVSQQSVFIAVCLLRLWSIIRS